jgi:Domain of unknown function DUF29
VTIELQRLNQTLYDRDFVAWIEETIDRLKAKDYSAVDWNNVIEELDTMGRRERKSLKSNLVILLLHLLKWQYQPALRSGSSKGSIVEHRQRIQDDLIDSPSLKPYLYEILVSAYLDACDRAAAETGLSLTIFPVDCDYPIESILDRTFFPD